MSKLLLQVVLDFVTKTESGKQNEQENSLIPLNTDRILMSMNAQKITNMKIKENKE